MILDVHLRDIETGVTKVFADDWRDETDIGTVVFMWTEGNWSCDCNRSIFLYGDNRPEYECNGRDNRIVVDKAVLRETGQVLCVDGTWNEG